MIVFYPVWFYLVPEDGSFMSEKRETKIVEDVPSTKNVLAKDRDWSDFKQRVEWELKLLRKKNDTKLWTSQQDYQLRGLRDSGATWLQISQILRNKTPLKCQRRYHRLQEQAKRWPKHIDDNICVMHEEQGLNWPSIASILNEQPENRTPLNAKQVKERYLFYLKPGINWQEWQIEQDLLLLELLHKRGRVWKELTAEFSNRTELQLKNRYYGTLKFVERKARQKQQSDQAKYLKQEA